jgi:hypothetical protein
MDSSSWESAGQHASQPLSHGRYRGTTHLVLLLIVGGPDVDELPLQICATRRGSKKWGGVFSRARGRWRTRRGLWRRLERTIVQWLEALEGDLELEGVREVRWVIQHRDCVTTHPFTAGPHTRGAI